MQISNFHFEINNIGLWPSWLRNVIVLTIFLLICLLGYIFNTEKQIKQLRQAQSYETSLKQTLHAKDSQARNLPVYQSQFQILNQRLAILLHAMPDHNGMPELLENILLEGNKAHVYFVQFKPLPENNKKFYAEIPIQITVKGSYVNLANFISRLVSLNSLIRVANFKIIPAPNHVVEGGAAAKPEDHLIMTMLIYAYSNISGKLSK